MPTYVYKFVETGETIEVQQSFTDEALTEAVHPSSGRTMAVKKVFTPVGVTFKGGGFYKTDSRGGGGSKAASSSDGKGESKSASTGDGGSSNGDSSGSSGSSSTSSTTSSAGTSSTSSGTPAASGS
jgi:predicted nucleic acid-binding Zn ribbon protein